MLEWYWLANHHQKFLLRVSSSQLGGNKYNTWYSTNSLAFSISHLIPQKNLNKTNAQKCIIKDG